MNVKKFVYVSTVNVVEVADIIDTDECTPRYTCIYSACKLVAELIGKTMSYNEKMEYVTALIAMPYGEGNAANTLPNVIMKQLLEGISPKLIEGNNLYDCSMVGSMSELANLNINLMISCGVLVKYITAGNAALGLISLILSCVLISMLCLVHTLFI